MKKFIPEIETLIATHSLKKRGKTLQDRRNLITRHTLFDGTEIVIKSFKIPNLINKIAYRYFRKSKARRSYEHAQKLHEVGIGTPKPIYYKEEFDVVGLTHSYYVCKFIKADYTYRDLVEDRELPDHEKILRQFVHFTHSLHENDILFKDHSPGNTLIEKQGDNYHFYLVDINRMEFKTLSFEQRIKNFSRLTPHKEMVATMSDEYAKITGESYEKVFGLMWKLTSKFQEKYYRKIRWKKKLGLKK